MWFSKPPHIGKAVLAAILVTVFGFIPGMGIPGALIILMVSPLPYTASLFESLKGDTGWSAAIVLTLLGPALALVTYVLSYGVIQKYTSGYKRKLLMFFAIIIVWYVTALAVLHAHARAQQENPERGTMMEYLP